MSEEKTEILGGHNKFYVNDAQGNQVVETVFISTGDHLSIIEHIDVDSSLKGQGVGKQLVARVVGKMHQEQRKIIPPRPFAKHEFDNTHEYDDIRAWRTGIGANRCAFFVSSTICRTALMGKATDQIRGMLAPYRRRKQIALETVNTQRF